MKVDKYKTNGSCRGNDVHKLTKQNVCGTLQNLICSYELRTYANLCSKLHDLAIQQIFQFYDVYRDTSTVIVHIQIHICIFRLTGAFSIEQHSWSIRTLLFYKSSSTDFSGQGNQRKSLFVPFKCHLSKVDLTNTFSTYR